MNPLLNLHMACRYASVVVVYAIRGNLVDACCALREMAQRNVVSWNAIIAGYSTPGNSEEELNISAKTKPWINKLKGWAARVYSDAQDT